MSFITAIFREPHSHKDWLVELLRVLQVHFHHHSILVFSEEGYSDPFIQHAELRKYTLDYLSL